MIKCGPLPLVDGGERIMEWRPPGKEYPVLHVLDGSGFLYIDREHVLNTGGGAMLTDDPTCQRSDQDTAAALYAAIMASEDERIMRFREEWMP